MENRKIRVLVIDDSALIRSVMKELIDREKDMECVGAAPDPLVAREMIKSLNPDVLTLDVEMPRMDGLDFLERLMRLRPMPVVMVSTLTEQGSDITFRALELGAVDFVPKPKLDIARVLKIILGICLEKKKGNLLKPSSRISLIQMMVRQISLLSSMNPM